MNKFWRSNVLLFFNFISWRLITSQHCSGFCHTLTWISHGVTCVPHPNPPSHLPLHPIPLGLPSAPGLNTCPMYFLMTIVNNTVLYFKFAESKSQAFSSHTYTKCTYVRWQMWLWSSFHKAYLHQIIRLYSYRYIQFYLSSIPQ